MSVGHVQRAFEEAGLPAVGVYVRSFAHIPELMGVARALITNHPMGRPLGSPGDGERQRDVVAAALQLLTSNEPVIADFDGMWRTGPPADG